MSEIGLNVTGLAEALARLKAFDEALQISLVAELRKAAGLVRDEAQSRFMEYNEKAAEGYRVVMRARGIDVEQKYRRVTGKRPDFGVLQMREALLPSLKDHEESTYALVEAALLALENRYSD